MVQLRHAVNLDVASMARNTGLQCAIWDAVQKKWYVSQALNGGGGDKEHTYIRRFSPAGRYEGYTKLTLGGHGAVIGLRVSVKGTPWIWLGMDSYNSRGSTITTKVTRLIWRQNHTYSRSDTGVQVIPSRLGNNLQPFSVTWPWVHIRRGLGTSEVYYRVKEEEMRSNPNPKVYGKIIAPKKGRPGSFQGCTSYGNDLYILSGNTNKTNLIQHFDWRTGKMVRQLPVSVTMLKAATRGQMTATSSFEPEGLQVINGKLHMGVRTGPPGKRRDFALVAVG